MKLSEEEQQLRKQETEEGFTVPNYSNQVLHVIFDLLSFVSRRMIVTIFHG